MSETSATRAGRLLTGIALIDGAPVLRPVVSRGRTASDSFGSLAPLPGPTRCDDRVVDRINEPGFGSSDPADGLGEIAWVDHVPF